MYIIYGYKTGMHNKRFIGIKPCTSCGKFTETYLSKSFFQLTLFYFIPIFGIPTGKYVRCGNCNSVRKLSKEEWKQLKEESKGMPKKKNYLQAYEQLKLLVLENETSDLDADVIYNRLMGKIDFTDESGHIRQLVNVYIENSRNAAAIAGVTEQAAAISEVTEQTAAAAEDDSTVSTEAVLPTTTAQTGELQRANTAAAPAAQGTIPTAYYTAAQQNSAQQPVPGQIPAGYYAGTALKESTTDRSNARFLWLLLAVPMLIAAIFFFAVWMMLVSDDGFISGPSLAGFVLFAVITGLDVLFWVLSLKKQKKIK